MKKIILMILITLILSTGCWDMQEIDQRIFPYSVAIDLNPEPGDEYIITMSYVNIKGIGDNAVQEQTVYVVSTTASSIFEASNKLATELAYPIYFKHLRVLILGQEISRKEDCVRQIVDGLARDFVINKKLKIATAEDKAKDILEKLPTLERQEEIEGTLFALLEENRSTSRYASKSLTDFIRTMDKGGVLVPRIKVEGDSVKTFGACIFKDFKLIGHMDEDQTRANAFIQNDVQTELIDTPYEDGLISYEIIKEDIERKLIVDEENLKMKIDIELEGSIQEYILLDAQKSDGVEEIDKMERAIKNKVEERLEALLNLIQKKYEVDTIGVEEYISKFYPKIWNEIEGDWEEIFPEMEIDINVDPKIRRRGLIK